MSLGREWGGRRHLLLVVRVKDSRVLQVEERELSLRTGGMTIGELIWFSPLKI